MKCAECEYRFICYTLAANERPKRIKVNWKITNTCGNCKKAFFGTKTKGYREVPRTVGYCAETEQLVHKQSTACDGYSPYKISHIDKLYADMREELALKNKKTKLPKYCEKEE